MKQVITAILVQVEVTPYDDAGRAMLRPKPIVLIAAEADIPKPVLDWVRGKLNEHLSGNAHGSRAEEVEATGNPGAGDAAHGASVGRRNKR